MVSAMAIPRAPAAPVRTAHDGQRHALTVESRWPRFAVPAGAVWPDPADLGLAAFLARTVPLATRLSVNNQAWGDKS